MKSTQKKKDLGIFYTPKEVVEFIYSILTIWKNEDAAKNARWHLHPSSARFPSVIDPACGEGVFLKTAISSGFTGYHPTLNIPYIFGIDLDPAMVGRWKEISIETDLFHGNTSKMTLHFHHQDGLIPLPANLSAPYKKGGLEQNDAVVGNPPYGGIGVDLTQAGAQTLLHALNNYEIFWYRLHKNSSQPSSSSSLQGALNFDESRSQSISKNVSPREVQQLASGMPIEHLFIERFFQLAKPNSWIAMVIPDGVLANSTSHYVRQFIADHGQVKLVVSLPRNTFKDTGTNAKTSILMIRKYNVDEVPDHNLPIFLASVNDIEKLPVLATTYQSYNQTGGL